MLLRFLLWTIIIFIAAKIIGSAIRYLRRAMTPNRHIHDHRNRSNIAGSNDIEDVPYEDVSNKQ